MGAPDSATPPRKTGAATWIVAAVVAGALVVYAVRRQGGDDKPSRPGDGVGAAFTLAEGEDAARVVVELESPAAMSDGPPMRIVRLDAADGLSPADIERLTGTGGGAALYVGPEKFNDNWKEKADAGQVTKDPAQFGHADAPYPGFARYTFRVPETGTYEIWIRAFWVDDCGNSVDLAVDDGPLFSVADSNVGRWTWRRLETPERAARRFPLDAGRDHTITLCNREDDCYLDQLLIRAAVAGLPDPVGPQPTD